jgi:hypothetical protein
MSAPSASLGKPAVACLPPLCAISQQASKQPIVEGMQVEVHWFEDSAQGNEHRVVVLRKL